MRNHARRSWHGVAFPPAARTLCNRCWAGIVGHRFGGVGADSRLRCPMVIVVWRDDDAPLEWNRQPTEHAGLTSNCRHRVIRQRRTKRQKHPCPLPQPTRAFGRCGKSNSHPLVHIVRQTEEICGNCRILLFSSRCSTVRDPVAASAATAVERRDSHGRRRCSTPGSRLCEMGR